MEFNDLTEEQKAKARACKTPEEAIALAQEEGFELTDEQLEAISGGGWRGAIKGDPESLVIQDLVWTTQAKI